MNTKTGIISSRWQHLKSKHTQTALADGTPVEKPQRPAHLPSIPAKEVVKKYIPQSLFEEYPEEVSPTKSRKEKSFPAPTAKKGIEDKVSFSHAFVPDELLPDTRPTPPRSRLPMLAGVLFIAIFTGFVLWQFPWKFDDGIQTQLGEITKGVDENISEKSAILDHEQSVLKQAALKQAEHKNQIIAIEQKYAIDRQERKATIEQISKSMDQLQSEIKRSKSILENTFLEMEQLAASTPKQLILYTTEQEQINRDIQVLKLRLVQNARSEL